MAEVPFAQQKVPGVAGQGSLTRRTIAILEDAGNEVGLDLVNGVGQGSFCKGCVGASGGTHDGGGVFDLRGSLGLAVAKVEEALRERGVAAWIRPRTFKDNGELLWPLHLHGVDAFDPQLSPEAEAQVDKYNANEDGLAGHTKEDTGRPHPKLVKFPDPLSEEEEMPLTSDDIKKIVTAVLEAPISDAITPQEGDTKPLKAVLANDRKRLHGVEQKVDEILTIVRKLG